MPTRFDHSALYNDDKVHTRTDILGDNPQRQARQVLLPQIAKMTRNAISTTPVPVEYFQRLKVGRRCSCFTIEDEPQALCDVCYGVGIVGGFQKRGTKIWVLDVTTPHVIAVNVSPDYSKPTRPIMWALHKESVDGYLQVSIPLRGGVGILDVMKVSKNNPAGTCIDFWIKSPVDLKWVPMTETSIKQRLQQHKLELRVVFRRTNTACAIPRLACFRLGWNLIPCTTLQIDVPRFVQSMTLAEFGIYESFTSQPFVFDDTLKHMTTEDWIYNVRDGTRWKLIEVTNNKPLDITLGWDTQARLIQNFENYSKVAVGNVLSTCENPPHAIFSVWQQPEKCEPCPADNMHSTLQASMHKPGHFADQTKGPK